MDRKTRVLVFGTFDPLHKGHIDFFRQAKALGEYLIVVVARDSAIRAGKGYEPSQTEQLRLVHVQEVKSVNETRLGSEKNHHYELLEELDFDILALGFDQLPSNEEVHRLLQARGKSHVTIARLQPFHPDRYKGSKIRHKKLAKKTPPVGCK